MLRKPLDWYYWLATALLLSASLFGARSMLAWTIALTAVQLAHFLLRARGSISFPAQVRAAYLGLLLLGTWPPLGFVHWIQFVGTWAMVLANYCLLARCLSLLPWNRQAPLSLDLVWRTFFSPPAAGGVLPARSA